MFPASPRRGNQSPLRHVPKGSSTGVAKPRRPRRALPPLGAALAGEGQHECHALVELQVADVRARTLRLFRCEAGLAVHVAVEEAAGGRLHRICFPFLLLNRIKPRYEIIISYLYSLIYF